MCEILLPSVIIIILFELINCKNLKNSSFNKNAFLSLIIIAKNKELARLHLVNIIFVWIDIKF